MFTDDRLQRQEGHYSGSFSPQLDQVIQMPFVFSGIHLSSASVLVCIYGVSNLSIYLLVAFSRHPPLQEALGGEGPHLTRMYQCLK